MGRHVSKASNCNCFACRAFTTCTMSDTHPIYLRVSMHSLVISTRRYLSIVLIIQTHLQVCSVNHAVCVCVCVCVCLCVCVCVRTVFVVKLSYDFGLKAFRLDFILYKSSSTKTCNKALKSLLQWYTNPGCLVAQLNEFCTIVFSIPW